MPGRGPTSHRGKRAIFPGNADGTAPVPPSAASAAAQPRCVAGAASRTRTGIFGLEGQGPAIGRWPLGTFGGPTPPSSLRSSGPSLSSGLRGTLRAPLRRRKLRGVEPPAPPQPRYASHNLGSDPSRDPRVARGHFTSLLAHRPKTRCERSKHRGFPPKAGSRERQRSRGASCVSVLG